MYDSISKKLNAYRSLNDNISHINYYWSTKMFKDTNNILRNDVV